MKYLAASFAVALLILIGCAHGKLGRIEQGLERGSITKSTPIYVESISAKETAFSGDKSADAARVAEEKTTIENLYNHRIVDSLKQKGFDARISKTPVKSGIVLKGKVTRFEHGSAAARIMVGLGAGSSNMYTDFTLEDKSKSKVLSKFEVIATSGGRGGLGAAASFMDAHINDGAEKVVEYLEKSM